MKESSSFSPSSDFSYRLEDKTANVSSYAVQKPTRLDGVRGTVSRFLSTEQCHITLLTALSLAIRLWHYKQPAGVIQDEIELCSQVNWYLQGKFFIGAVPPLSGMLYAYVANHIAGYTGTESVYYPGQTVDVFPLGSLRLFTILTGALLAPITYMTVKTLGHGRLAASMAAGLVILENGLVTQSKFVMAEGLLCFFAALTGWAWATQMKRQEREPFSIPWSALMATGVGIGCTLSVKWQGAFTLAIPLISSVFYLWRILGEKRFSLFYITRQCVARLLTTLVLPTLVYLAIFQVHLAMVSKAGDHDLVVSPRLRYSLEGNAFEPSQKQIVYGSSVVIRHLGSNGGYLHSHFRRYKTGSTQQEVSLYPYADLNNVWIIHKAGQRWNVSQPIEPVKNNDKIMLEHYATSRKLHSHDHRPPVTNKKEQNEVSGYGDPYVYDPNDYWWIQMLYDDNTQNGKDTTPIHAIETRFRLLHHRICHLLSHGVRLPNEENPQQEVTCMTSPKKEVTSWTIESAFHEELEDNGETISYTPVTPMEKLIEVHQLMLQYTGAIHDRLASKTVPDPKYQHQLYELQKPKPLRDWFLGSKAFKYWETVTTAIYLTLSPVGRFLMALTLCGSASYLVLDTVLKKRQVQWWCLWKKKQGDDAAACAGYDPVATRERYYQSMSYLTMATLVQAVSLQCVGLYNLRMGDILPNTLYSAILSAVAVEAVSFRLPRTIQMLLVGAVLATASMGFYRFHQVTYGSGGEMRDSLSTWIHGKKQHHNVGDMATWNLDLPGKIEPCSYTVGEEEVAEKDMAMLVSVSYSHAAKDAAGETRYHAVQPTTGPTEDDIRIWHAQVQEAALKRIKKKEEELMKKLEEEEKKKKMEEEEEKKKMEKEEEDEEETGDNIKIRSNRDEPKEKKENDKNDNTN